MKHLARAIVAKILGYQVKRLIQKNRLKVIGVVGSIGKTSTKMAIAQVLSTKYCVRYQAGNYNDLVTVPLIFFGQTLPSLFNPFAWLAVFWRNQHQLWNKYPYDIVVVELGSDKPGLLAEFRNYLKLDTLVVTAITPEHMLEFKNLDSVAKEELAATKYANLLIYNQDLCPKKYINAVSIDRLGYGLADETYLSKPQSYSRQAAIMVATQFGLSASEIKNGLKNIRPVAGRMQKLEGKNGSLIIDDSYNASPDAVKLALDSLYNFKSTHKIALLGNMNEMGDLSEAYHTQIGEYCDPKQLDLVVTLGPDANKYLAPAASTKGCKVESVNSPYSAGDLIRPLLTKDTVVLVKGSQNRVFAEEAIKSLLADPEDVDKLVRQSPDWMKVKQKAFKL